MPFEPPIIPIRNSPFSSADHMRDLYFDDPIHYRQMRASQSLAMGPGLRPGSAIDRTLDKYNAEMTRRCTAEMAAMAKKQREQWAASQAANRAEFDKQMKDIAEQNKKRFGEFLLL